MIGDNASTAHGTVSVLVVDDDKWAARAVAAALSDDDGLTVAGICHSGDDAVAVYEERRPDVVLMDVNMAPGMNGVDATAAIMRLNAEARVVLLTTVSPGPGIARALEAGALAAVNKSTADDVLVGVVTRAARGESPGLLASLAADIAVSGDPLPDAPALAPSLTSQELAVLHLICQGKDYSEIARDLILGVNTVKTHTRSLRDKLHASSLAQLVVRALQYKFYTPA
ncbi:response regulator [Sediminivirga luteola]|uniref:response regulator n=1 Tax=Sediminivirga luteola TaxID=1774748 RepID=UPI001F58E5AC|nr:response regulator transcription factor [Sediminivirga luteola]